MSSPIVPAMSTRAAERLEAAGGRRFPTEALG